MQQVVLFQSGGRVAKVYRERMMQALDRIYPDYGFYRHQGYATVEHRERIARFGPCQQHRRSFRPFCIV